MLNIIKAATVAAVALTVVVASNSAQARDGEIGAGVLGGIAAGAIVGSQMNRNDGYRDDNGYRRYRGHAGYRDCHTERREFEDRYGRLHVRRVRVCD